MFADKCLCVLLLFFFAVPCGRADREWLVDYSLGPKALSGTLGRRLTGGCDATQYRPWAAVTSGTPTNSLSSTDCQSYANYFSLSYAGVTLLGTPAGCIQDSNGVSFNAGGDGTLCGENSWDCIQYDGSCTTLSDCLEGTHISVLGGAWGGDRVCSQCAPGKVSAAVNEGSCSPCPSLHYQDQYGQSACVACSTCDAGKRVGSGTGCGSTQAENNRNCDDCSPGQYSTNQNEASCSACPGAEFQDEYGKTDCKSCTTCSTGTSVTAGTGCGSAQKTTDRTCTDCSPGLYNDQLGRQVCKSCPAGTSTNGVYQSDGLDDCIDCVAGKYTTSTGTANCHSCNTGKYGDQTARTSESTSCTPCAVGYYANGYAMTSCTECTKGKFAESTGHSTCPVCPMGKYNTANALSTCQDCIAGKYIDGNAHTDHDAVSDCKPCAQGRYGTTPPIHHCAYCPTGQYGDQTGKTTATNACKDCARGKYNDQSPGTSSNQTPITVCKNCEAGRYQLEGAKPTCTRCEAGKINSMPSLTGKFYEYDACDALCAPGKYGESTGGNTVRITPPPPPLTLLSH